MKIEDILEPYQVDSRYPLQIVKSFEADINWFGVQRHIIIAHIAYSRTSSVSKFRMCWLLDGDDGAWWLAEEEFPHHIATCFRELNAEESVRVINSRCEKRNICRFFYLNGEPQDVTITLDLGYYFNKEMTSFHVDWGNIENWVCSATKNRFDSALADKESDAAFALQISGLEGVEALAFAYGFDDVSQYEKRQEQFKTLAQEAIRCAIVQSQQSSWQAYDEYLMSISPRYNMYHPVGLEMTTMYPVYFEMTEEDAYLLNLIRQFGPLQITEERIKKYHSLQVGPKALIPFTVSKLTTFHERLEAKVQLLDWAKTHLPSEKYAEVEKMESNTL